MIMIKTAEELRKMRRSGELVYLTHQELKKHLKPGVTTQELDKIAARFIAGHGAIASFKGYNGFPGSICASINEELVHGIPGKRMLKEGDLISIDVGVCYDGYHGDSAWTYPIGRISDQAKRLLEVTEESLYRGIEQVGPHARMGDVSHAIEECVESAGFHIVKEYVGHGIGRDLHEDPAVPNYGIAGKGLRLRAGMVLAIEPMVCMGGPAVHTLSDRWTVVTRDKSLCAHFEHTVAITDTGYSILTTSGSDESERRVSE